MAKNIKIEIKSYLTGSVLFEYTSDDNNILTTLKEALKNGANLRSANLYGANLYGADLYGANLYGANLYGANLYGANLRSANLYGADLRSADLRSANLYGANLYGADLRSADLRSANLYGANLRSANLRSANLYGADLSTAKNADLAIAMTRILPEGDIIGYKKCQDNKIVKLLIPNDAKRSSAFGRKCRAEFAQVLEITKGNRQLKTAISKHDIGFTYKVGETVRPDKFDENWADECSSGIHFFITKIEAEDYN